MGSPRVRVIVRLVNKVGPTGRCVLSTLGTNGRMISTGGSLVTMRNRRLLSTTRRDGISFLFRTTMTNNVPVVEPLGRYLTKGRVARIVNVMGKAAGFVLAGVARRNVRFGSTLTLTARLKCTRTSPATSVRNLSTKHGMTVLTSITFGSHIMFGSMCARKVTGVASGSVRCTGRVKHSVGLLNITEGRTSKVRTCIYPVLVPDSRPLTAMGSSCGTMFIRKSTIRSTVFFKEKTKRLPATDTIINSMFSVIEGVLTKYYNEVKYAYCGGVPIGGVRSARGHCFLHLGMRSHYNILTRVATVFTGCRIDITRVVRGSAGIRNYTRMIIVARGMERNSFEATVRRLEGESSMEGVSAVVHMCKGWIGLLYCFG